MIVLLSLQDKAKAGIKPRLRKRDKMIQKVRSKIPMCQKGAPRYIREEGKMAGWLSRTVKKWNKKYVEDAPPAREVYHHGARYSHQPQGR